MMWYGDGIHMFGGGMYGCGSWLSTFTQVVWLVVGIFVIIYLWQKISGDGTHHHH